MRRIKIEEHTRLSDELENWLMSYKTMNVTTVTLKNYRHIIKDLIRLIGDIPVQELNEQVITMYTEKLMLRITNFRTIASYLRNVKVFVNWLIKTEKIAPFKITLPKTEKVPKEPYTEAELKRLLIQPSKKRFCAYRNWVAINILIGTGCRRRSLLNIKIQDLDLFNQHITFRVTKNKYACQTYLDDRMQAAGLERPVFTEAACSTIHAVSQGIPRMVNQLAGSALMLVQRTNDNAIEERHVSSIIADMERQRGTRAG